MVTTNDLLRERDKEMAKKKPRRRLMRGRPSHKTYCYDMEKSREAYSSLAHMSHYNEVMIGDLVSITSRWPEGAFATRVKSYADLFPDCEDPSNLSWHEVVALQDDGLVSLRKNAEEDLIHVPFHVLKTEHRDFVTIRLPIACVKDLVCELTDFADSNHGFVVMDMAVTTAIASMGAIVDKYNKQRAKKDAEEKAEIEEEKMRQVKQAKQEEKSK